MCGENATGLTQVRDFAHSHVMRVNILALITEDKSRSLDPSDLRRGLPGEPNAIEVRYHLKVLQSAALLPPRGREKGSGSAL
jgi:hypothetical protein